MYILDDLFSDALQMVIEIKQELEKNFFNISFYNKSRSKKF